MGLGLLLGAAVGLIVFMSVRDGVSRSPLYDERLVTELFQDASPAVVEIQVSRIPQDETFRSLFPNDTGSGFLVDRQGHVVTNYHVVDRAQTVKVTLSDGRTVDGAVVGTSPVDDLALVKLDPADTEGIEPLKLADSELVRPGELAVAIGSPFRLLNFMSVGVVSGVGQSPPVLRRPIPDMIWTDAPLSPGNSGGPLLNADGEVIGVTSAVQVGSAGQFQIGFAVPSDIVRDLMPKLIDGGLFRRAWLGISGTSLDTGISSSLGIGVDKGVYIRRVLPGTPAERVNLRGDPSLTPSGKGDVIVAVDGRPVASVGDLVRYFNALRPGVEVVLTVYRDSANHDIEVTLGEWTGT